MTKYAGRDLVLLIGSPTAVVVGQVTALGNAGSTRNLIDASAYGDAWTDYVVGQQDGTEVDIEVAYAPTDTQHMALITAYNAGVPSHFEMQHAVAGFHVQWSGLLVKCERGAPRDGLLTMVCSVKILNPGVTDAP